MGKKSKHNRFGKRMKSMLAVDFRRMLTMPLFYIAAGTSFVIPILVLVMTTMMAGTVTVDPNTGIETTVEAFESVWQSVGSVSSSDTGMDMSLTGMCNINLLYFLAAVFICIFVSDDFRSGFAKNLFTVRARKTDYVISKTLTGFTGGMCMILVFLAGAMLGGAISGLPFDMGAVNVENIIMCLLSKILLMAVFSPIYVLMSVVGKQKLWKSMLLSLFVGMLFFNIVPMLTPLDSGMQNVLMCFMGGALFSVGIGSLSIQVLSKTSLV